MPYVNVKITREQKAEVVRRVTEALVDVLDKKPGHTHVVIDEVDTDNWGFAGQLTTDYRRGTGGA